MFNSLKEELFLSQKVTIKKKYSNVELNLITLFRLKTKIFPDNIIIRNNFIFFFVKSEDYFKAKMFLGSIRKIFPDKKVLIIRAERILRNLLFGFFPDTYIHDIRLEIDSNTENKTATVLFLSFVERGIAVGRSGDYIKAVNDIIKNFVKFEKKSNNLKIKCELINR